MLQAIRNIMRVISIILTLALVSYRRDNNKLTILFDNVEGLETGGEVYYKGIKVGEVTHLDLFKDKVAADIKLNDSIRIPVAQSLSSILLLLVLLISLLIRPGRLLFFHQMIP